MPKLMKKKKNNVLGILLLVVFTHGSYSGILDDVAEAVKHPGDIPNRIGKEIKRTPKNFENIIEKGGKNLSNTNDNISSVWNEWREDKLDPIGHAIKSGYKALKAGHKGNPQGFLPQIKSSIPNPDIQVLLNQQLVRKLLNQFISEQIPLDKDAPHNGNYFYFDEASFSNDAARRVMVLKIVRGRLKFKFITRNTLKVDGATFEFLPKIRKTNDRLFLDLYARMTYLNIHDVLPIIEQGIAHGLNDHFINRDSENGFMSIDLTEKFGKSIEMPTVDRHIINTSLSEAAIFVDGNTLIYQARLSESKN